MILIQILEIFHQLSFFIRNTFIILSGILYYKSYYSKINGRLSGGCTVVTLKLFVNIAQSFLSIFQQGNISAKYNLSHMIYAVCFKDSHPGKQTYEREAVSMSYFQVKAFSQFLDTMGLEDCSVIMQTPSSGQEAVFALLSMPSTKQPVPWQMSFLSALQLSLAASYIFLFKQALPTVKLSHNISMLSLPFHQRYEKNALF